MNQDPSTPSDADAEFAEAWGDDAIKPQKPSKQAQDAADAAKREQDEFDLAFLQSEDGAK